MWERFSNRVRCHTRSIRSRWDNRTLTMKLPDWEKKLPDLISLGMLQRELLSVLR